MANDSKSGGSRASEAGSREESEEGSTLKIGDALKKILTAGIGAAFMTEESVRTYLSEIKLPKEVLNLLLQSAAKSKEELMTRVGNEVIKILSKIDFVKEASRFVEEHKFKISAEVEVVKKDHRAERSSTET